MSWKLLVVDSGGFFTPIQTYSSVKILVPFTSSVISSFRFGILSFLYFFSNRASLECSYDQVITKYFALFITPMKITLLQSYKYTPVKQSGSWAELKKNKRCCRQSKSLYWTARRIILRGMSVHLWFVYHYLLRCELISDMKSCIFHLLHDFLIFNILDSHILPAIMLMSI